MLLYLLLHSAVVVVVVGFVGVVGGVFVVVVVVCGLLLHLLTWMLATVQQFMR